MATKKKYKYHKSATFKSALDGSEHNYQTQLYQIGVYIIYDGRADMQGNVTPGQMEAVNKKMLNSRQIQDLQFGPEITVQEDEDGFWKEIE